MPLSKQTCEAGLALSVSGLYQKVIHVITEDARDGMGIKFGFSFIVEMQHCVMRQGCFVRVVVYAIHDEQGMVESIWPEITW
jgi:hypothetical protein